MCLYVYVLAAIAGLFYFSIRLLLAETSWGKGVAFYATRCQNIWQIVITDDSNLLWNQCFLPLPLPPPGVVELYWVTLTCKKCLTLTLCFIIRLLCYFDKICKILKICKNFVYVCRWFIKKTEITCEIAEASYSLPVTYL